MTDNSATKINSLFRGTREIPKNEGNYFSNLSDHMGERGRLNESHLKNVLQRHLPKKFALGTGFIVSSKTINKDDNPQLDIILYDNITNAPLYQSDAFGIYPIESVYGYVEVKTTLNEAELQKSFKINAKIRTMASSGDKVYLAEGESKLSPRFFMFAYKSTVKSETIKTHVKRSFENQGDAHAHGIFVLDKNLFVARQARNDANVVELHEREGPSAFADFIVNMAIHCEQMISSTRIKIDNKTFNLPPPTTLPLANIPRYFTEGQ